MFGAFASSDRHREDARRETAGDDRAREHGPGAASSALSIAVDERASGDDGNVPTSLSSPIGMSRARGLFDSNPKGPNMKTRKTEARTTDQTETAIETIEVVQLDDVIGGCAACGNANCGAGATTARQNLMSAFRR